MESTARFSEEISASATGSKGALRNGGSDRGLRQRRGSMAEIDRAAMVRRQSCRMSEANIDTEKSLEKSCKELPQIGDLLRPAQNPAGTKCAFGVRSWKEMGNRGDGFYSTPNELERAIDAFLFFSGEEPHYSNYPKGDFDPSELEIA